jgi:hypothetical protein
MSAFYRYSVEATLADLSTLSDELIDAIAEDRPHESTIYFASERALTQLSEGSPDAVTAALAALAGTIGRLAEEDDAIPLDRLPFWKELAGAFSAALSALSRGQIESAENWLTHSRRLLKPARSIH